MILNHKEAIQYVVDNLAEVAISRRDLFNIHALLADGLLADPALAGRLRRMLVGIAHSSYRPIDNRFVIEEEFDVLRRRSRTGSSRRSFFSFTCPTCRHSRQPTNGRRASPPTFRS